MRIIKAGATSQSIYVEILDSTSTTGGRKTGLVYNSAGLTAYYALVGASAVQITLATLAAANSAWSSGGFKEVDATNMPGVYRLDVPNAALASGPGVVITLKGATGMVQVSVEIQLVAIDLQDAVRLGLTALPNAAAEAAGGLYTRGSGAGQINQPANGQIDANAVKLGGTTQTGRDIGASVLLSSGTGTGQLDFTSGVVKANLVQILGTALTETAGQIAAAFKQFFDVASPTGTMKAITNVVTTTNVTTVNGLAANVITAASVATGAIDADALAADAVTEIWAGSTAPTAAAIADAVLDEDMTAHQTQGTLGQAIGDPAADTNTIYKAVVTDAAGANIAADIIAIKAVDDAILVDTGTTLDAALAVVDGNVDTILADTNDIQTRLPAALTAGGNMKADMVALNGGAQSAADLKDFADDGYDPATNKVQGVVLVDTTTTLTNAPSDSSGVTTLLSRLSAVRAGYLDNLSAGAVALEASVQSVLSKLLKYVQLILRKDAAIATDNATEVTAINANGGSGGGAFANTTDSQEALRDRGDAAWITATGFSTLSQADVRTAIGLASANLDTQLDALPTAAENADAVWNEDATAHQTQGTFGQAIGDPGADTDTIFGLVNTNLNATISSRSSQASVDDLPTNAELATALAAADDAVLAAIASLSIPTAAANADAVWDEALSGHLGAGSAGEALSAAGSAGDPWSTALPGAYGAGTAGKIIGDNLNATISSRSTQTSVDDLPTNAELATALAAADDAVLAAIAALNNISQADVRTAVGLASANLDTQLAALPTAAENADAVWDEDATGHQTQGTFGQAIGDPGADTDTIFGLVNTNLNATVSSRASQTSVDDLPTNSELATALAAADDAILAAIALLNDLSEADVRAAVGLASANLDTQLGTLPTAAENADAVWDEALADHLGAGSTGEALNAAGAAGDPWSTALPGAYGAGTAGKIIGENLNATVSSRASQISVDDLPTNAELATALAAADDAILAAIAALNDLSAAEVTAAVPTAVQNADALLKRDWNSVSGEATRSALNALRFVRNRFSTVVTPGSVTVYKEDDTTVAFTKSLTTDAAAEPIVEG